MTGPFGSGKSSVIKTLIEKEKNNKDLKFLTLSLATLDAINDTKIREKQREDGNGIKCNETEQNEASSDRTIYENHIFSFHNNEVLNRKIEYSILQQLVYREKRETLPNSRFKRIPYIPEKTIKNITLSIIVFIFCFLIVFEPKWCQVEILYRIFDWGYWINGICDIISLILMCIILYIYLRKLITFSGNARLNQISIIGSEIQIKDENSIFNHHLDEILYFFQCTEYNVVIIEDLDRFNTTDIFLKLRELNYLLNQSNIVGRKITFVYAIKDDLFVDSSRTKFFDYITTVIPVISFYNSKTKLREALDELGHNEQEIDNETVKEVSFFIDDMRLLKNIVNEYHQYCLHLGCGDNHKINYNKLLAMIVYKNYYPNDFALLPKRAGEIYAALCPDKKREYQDIAVNKVLSKREELANKKLEALHNTQRLHAEELRMIYVMAYVKKMGNMVESIRIDKYDKPVSFFWESEEAFKLLITKNKINYISLSAGYRRSEFLTVSFAEIEKEVDPVLTYNDRINAINIEGNEINKEIDDINNEKILIRSYSIKALIMKFSLYNEKCYKDIGLSDMADRFIRIGLIEEDYNYYISCFYPGITTINDHNLILDMKLDRKPDYRAHIDNIKDFLKELSDDVFLTQSIYNIELLDYLVCNSVLEKNYYNLFLHQLLNDKPFDFITIYYKEGKYAECLLKTYIQKMPYEIWEDITIMAETNDKKIMREIWLKYCSVKQIKNIQLEWINNNFDFISYLYPNLSDDKKKFFTTETKYITLSEEPTEMLDSVIDNRCYIKSKNTIPVVFKHRNAYDNINLVDLEEQKLSLLLGLPNPTWKNISLYYKNNEENLDIEMLSFIEKNIETLCLSKYDGEEDIECLLFNDLMNSNELTFDNYIRIGKCFDGQIFVLFEMNSRLEEERLCWLIENGFIEYSDENVHYIQNYSNKVVCEYIIYNKSNLIKDINKYSYNNELALYLLGTDRLTNSEKALILEQLNPEIISMTQPLANAICRLLSTKIVEWNYSLLKDALSMSSNKEDVLKVVIYTIKDNIENNRIITEVLQLLHEPYSKITEGNKRPILEITPLNKILLDLLKEINYISKYSIESKGFRVYTKYKKINEHI